MQHTFVLEVYRKNAPENAPPELHGCGAAGVPGVTAQMVADHLGKHGHFNRYARRVVVKHRSHMVKATADKVHFLRKDDLPKVEVDEEAKKQAPDLQSLHPQPNMAEGSALPQKEGTTKDDIVEEQQPMFAPPDYEASRAISKALGGSGQTLRAQKGDPEPPGGNA